METANGRCGIDEAWVIVVHAVDVGPDLDLVDLESSTDEGSGVVATASLEVVDVAEGIATDIALGDEEPCTLGCSVDELLEMGLDIGFVGLSLLVRAHVLEGREAYGFDPSVGQMAEHHRRAQEFASS